MVTEPYSYPFSSYPAFISQVKAQKWLELNWLLSLFGQSRRSAPKNYRDFVEKVDKHTHFPILNVLNKGDVLTCWTDMQKPV